MLSTTKNKGAARRKPRVYARCKVCERPVLEESDPLGIDVLPSDHHRAPHHVEICADCVHAITTAGVRRNKTRIFPGLEGLL